VIQHRTPATRRSAQNGVHGRKAALVWIHKGSGSIRTNVLASVCEWELGSSVVRNTHNYSTTVLSSSSTPSPFAQCCCCCPAPASRLRSCIVALGIFWSPLFHRRDPGRGDTQAGRNLGESLDHRATTELMPVRPRRHAGHSRARLRLATLRPPDRLETRSFFRDKATFRSVCRRTAARCDW
jgi:hypothetical protein